MSYTNYTSFIGIDIAKDSFVANLYGDQKAHQFQNNAVGFKDFEKCYSEALKEALIVLETTGRYEWKALTFLVESGYRTHRVHAAQGQAYIRSLGQKNKTDLIDAKALAQYGKERHESLKLFKIPDESLEKLNLLIRRKNELMKMQHQEKMRLQAPANEGIQECVQEHLNYLESAIEVLQTEIDVLFENEQDLKNKLKIAQEIPGIGPKTGQALLALVPELGHLGRGVIASLVGVAPVAKDSGKSSGYRATAKGRESVKRVLFTSAMAAARSKSHLGEHYLALVARGKKKMVALMALMRKILVILNAKIRDYYKAQEALSS